MALPTLPALPATSTLDDTSLEALAIELQNYKDAVLVQLVTLVTERNRRAALKDATAKLALATDGEKAALAQVLQAQGVIPSAESVPTPG